MTRATTVQETAFRPRYGMVGGGKGAFIGDVHRKAIALDRKAELVAGSFSSSYDNTKATGKALDLDDSRLYEDFEAMAEAEGSREDGIDFVVIVTPNFLHYPVAKVFLENNIHVVCDKPLTFTVEEAEELAAIADERDLLFCVTHTYTGYPTAKHVRDIIADGDIGNIRFVQATYAQEWLATLLEETDHKQASWRGDPNKSGPVNCMGDIGSHVENMVSYMTGLRITRLLAKLETHVEGRKLDDSASIMLEYEGGATGLYWCSQIAIGNDNNLRIAIYGDKGSIEWAQENPNYITLNSLGGPRQIISRGRDPLTPNAQTFSRVPGGHPEGYQEAFANLYSAFIDQLAAKLADEDAPQGDYPTVQAGIDGVRFITRCVESSQQGNVWVDF